MNQWKRPVVAGVATGLLLFWWIPNGGGDVADTAVALDGPQVARYVAEISRAAQDRGLGTDGAVIGVATALTESGMRILANPAAPGSFDCPHEGVGSDHTSVGIFQQQNNWGPACDRMDPYTSAGKFFDAMIEKYPNWSRMDPGDVAQGVQQSAYPDRYATHMGRAKDLVAAVSAA